MELKLMYLYPNIMNFSGSRGNVIALHQRCAWRGMKLSVTEVGLEEAPEFTDFDLVYLGGGRDRDQLRIETDLRKTKADSLKTAVENGLVMLAICGGMQMLGEYCRPLRGPIIQGIGLLDLRTEGDARRPAGDIITQAEFESDKKITMIGFESHSGRTYIGPDCKMLGKVIRGFGNNGEDGGEGIRYRNCFGTYLHGPVLPRNPEFADYLILLALRRKYGKVELSPLDDSLEQATKTYMKNRIFTRYWLRGNRL